MSCLCRIYDSQLLKFRIQYISIRAFDRVMYISNSNSIFYRMVFAPWGILNGSVPLATLSKKVVARSPNPYPLPL